MATRFFTILSILCTIVATVCFIVTAEKLKHEIEYAMTIKNNAIETVKKLENQLQEVKNHATNLQSTLDMVLKLSNGQHVSDAFGFMKNAICDKDKTTGLVVCVPLEDKQTGGQ